MGLGRIFLGVGYHDDGCSLGVQFLQQVHHLFAILGVEVAGRLVGEDQLRSGHDGAGDGHPLLLTAGELLREVLGAVADGHALHDFRDLLLALGSGDVEIPQRQFDVLIHIEFVDKVETLEHETDIAFAELGALFLLEVRHLGAEEFIAAAGRVVQQAQDIQQRGLAADLPQPEGPMMATNSPSLISKDTPLSAVVSISSVRKTLVRLDT